MNELESVRRIALRAWKEDGCLVPIEAGKDFPFPIARVFYVFGVPAGHTRGKHAHYRCNQVLICLKGKIQVICDDGTSKRELTLDSPETALHLPPGIWAEQIYQTGDALLMVLTDRPYEADDYIRDYATFQSYRQGKGAQA